MQGESALMHYHKLQSQPAEVEAMAMNFEQRAADKVAEAGFRAKPGPKKKGSIYIANTASGRGKTNFSKWTSKEIGVENQTSAKAPPRKLKEAEKDNLRAAMEVKYRRSYSAIGIVIYST
jgi:hypothetical protein